MVDRIVSVGDDFLLPPEVVAANLEGLGSVDSVNGQTGVVVLNAAHVGAATPADVTTASTADRDRANHTGTQAAATITGLAPVATTGAYADLTGKPTIPAAPSDASTTAKGIVELATTAETTAGTDAVRAVTPAGVKAATNALEYTRVTVDGMYQAAVEIPSTPVTAADVGAIPIEARGAVDGVASLDGTGKVPLAQLPDVSGGVRAPAVTMSAVGLYTTPVIISTGTLLMALDTVYACPIVFDEAVTLDRIGLRVTTAGSADNVLQAGIFGNAAARPSAPLVQVTATPNVANSTIEWTINQPLAAGVYWLGISSHIGTAPTVRAGALVGAQMALDAAAIIASTLPAALIQNPYATTTALPNPFVPSGVAALMPRIHVRRSA